jgi:S1-C subfamily serine protease
MTLMSAGIAKTRLRPASRQRWRALAGTAVVLSMMVWAGFSLGGCTFEFGDGTDSTAQSATTVTQPTGATGATQDTTSTTTSGNVVASGDGLASPALAVSDILAPSVVNISVTMNVAGPFGQQYSEPAEGSGVIYSADGMIITNNHVVTDDNGDPVTDLTVTFITGEKLPATIVGTDPLTDLAVIRVNAGKDLPAATFVNDQPNVGEYAVAIGSPLGYENSVTLGIVSGLGRSIDEVEGPEGIALTNLIQTDAPISPGNSGGALANASGQVIGINVAYAPPETGAVSIGFAIPSVVVTQVADEIISTGKATHAYLGVGTQTVTSELQKTWDLSRSSGILVASVTSGGPAAKAGIKQGDIILKVDDEEMIESPDLLVAIRDKKPGDKVDVTIDRNGATSVITVTLEERPAELF